MPSNKREGIIFGLMMVFCMVSIMMVYNLYMEGLLGTLTVGSAILQFIFTFMVAFIVESLIGPLMRKIALKLPYDKSKKVYLIIANSTCMVIGMVICMSLFGLIMSLVNGGIEGSVFQHYMTLIGRNFILAYPAQLLVVGPLVRWIFVKYIQEKNSPQFA